MEVVVEKLGDGFGSWNVLGSDVALEHGRALGIGGLAYFPHQFGPAQSVQDGIAEAFAGILELSNVKQNSCPLRLHRPAERVCLSLPTEQAPGLVLRLESASREARHQGCGISAPSPHRCDPALQVGYPQEKAGI